MNKETVRAFLKWLDAASEEQIDQARKELLTVLQRVNTPTTRADARFSLRLLDEEVLSRTELYRSQQG